MNTLIQAFKFGNDNPNLVSWLYIIFILNEERYRRNRKKNPKWVCLDEKGLCDQQWRNERMSIESKSCSILPRLLACCALLSSDDPSGIYSDPSDRGTGKSALQAPKVKKTISASQISTGPVPVWPWCEESPEEERIQDFYFLFYFSLQSWMNTFCHLSRVQILSTWREEKAVMFYSQWLSSIYPQKKMKYSRMLHFQ